MIKLQLSKLDTENRRVYFNGSNSHLYCLQIRDRVGNMDLMLCTKDGEPESNVIYPQLFDFSDVNIKINAIVESNGSDTNELIKFAKLNIENLGFKRIEITANNSTYTLIKSYRDKLIAHNDGVICVIDPSSNSVFIPSLDDSKSSGARFLNLNENNISGAMKYIDYICGENNIALTIGTFDEDGNPVGEIGVTLSQSRLEDIISHSAQFVASEMDGDIYAELKNALETAGLIDVESHSLSMDNN